MEEKQCRLCIYYCQHYTLSGGKLISVCCGHCLKNIHKRMRPDTTICDRFEENTADLSELFASREYLTKALLKKVMDMELLPEIKND